MAIGEGAEFYRKSGRAGFRFGVRRLIGSCPAGNDRWAEIAAGISVAGVPG